MKETFFFSHDYNARTDTKIKKLLARHGMQGYGIFWAIVEDLYNNANALQMDIECIAYDLRSDENVVRSVLFDFELFVISETEISSKSVESRLNRRNEKSIKASESARARWDKVNNNANALRTHSGGNAIEENKVKESKEEKKKKSTPKKAFDPISCDLSFFSPGFSDYWSDWCEYRKEKKNPLGEKGAKIQLEDLKIHGESVAKQMIRNAIKNGWSGLFPLKDHELSQLKTETPPVRRPTLNDKYAS